VGSAPACNSGRGGGPDGGRTAAGELGPAGGEAGRRGLGSRSAGARLGPAALGSAASAGSAGIHPARCASRSSAYVGCAHSRGATTLADQSGRPDLGGRTACAAASGCAGSIVGRLAARGTSRAHVGLARAGAERVCSAPDSVVGSAQAGDACARRAGSGPFVERPRRPLVGRAAEQPQGA